MRFRSWRSASGNQAGTMAVLRLLLSLLIVWLILADCLLARQATTFPHPSAGIMLGLLLGEATLVATWFACSKQNWVMRQLVTGATLALLAWPASLYSGPSWRQWVGLLLLLCAVTTAIWKILLASGWRWQCQAYERSPERASLSAHQYSLATMLEWLTTSAVTLGMGSWLALPDKQPWLAALSIVWAAGLSVCCFAAVLAETRSLWTRFGWLLGAIACALAMILLASFNHYATLMSLVAATQAVVTLVAATLLSIGGVALIPVATESTAQGEWPPPAYPRAGAL